MKRMVKKIFLIILVFFLIMTGKELLENNPERIKKQVLLKEISPAQTQLKIKYLGFLPMGTARIIERGIVDYEGKKVVHLEAKTKISKWLRLFFDARAGADSYIDPVALHSLRFNYYLEVPEKPREEKSIIYDQDKHIMEIDGERRLILPDTQDPLSCIYYLQQQVLGVGKTFDLNLNTNQKNYQLLAVVKEKKDGFWRIEAKVGRRDGSLRRRMNIMFYLLDDERKTPLLIKVSGNFGVIVAISR